MPARAAAPSRRHLLATATAGAALAVLRPFAAAGASVARVAAASDLRFALSEAASAFEATGEGRLNLVFGSSGNLRRQIASGAPFQLFLSADEGYVAELVAEGHAVPPVVVYGLGRLVLLVPSASALPADDELAGIAAMVAAGRPPRLAIANPDHAPYGRAARQALRRAGLWDALHPRLVLGETVSQAAQFALSGGIDGAIVALSLIHGPGMAARGRHVAIAGHLYEPLRQGMALLRGAGPVAAAFHDFLRRPAGEAVLRRHGFTPPDRPADGPAGR